MSETNYSIIYKFVLRNNYSGEKISNFCVFLLKFVKNFIVEFFGIFLDFFPIFFEFSKNSLINFLIGTRCSAWAAACAQAVFKKLI